MKDKLKVQVLEEEIRASLVECGGHFKTMYGGGWDFAIAEQTYPQDTISGEKIPAFVLTLDVITDSQGPFPGFSDHPDGRRRKKLWQRAYELGKGSELTACKLVAYQELFRMGFRTFNGLTLVMEAEELNEVSNPTNQQ